MEICLVVLDADGTLWDHEDITILTLPFKRISEDSIIDIKGECVNLKNDVRELLRELKKRGIFVTLVTWNKPEHVYQALRLFGIEKYFDYVKAEFHPNKHLMIKEILQSLEKKGIKLKPEQILYVDDRTVHLEDIRREIGNIRFIQMNKDIKNLLEVLRYL